MSYGMQMVVDNHEDENLRCMVHKASMLAGMAMLKGVVL